MNELLFDIDVMLSELSFPIVVYYDDDFKDWVYRIRITSDDSLVVHSREGYTKLEAYGGVLRSALGLIPLEDRVIQ